MDKKQQKEKMIELMSNFISLVSYKLPDDVESKLRELSEEESNQLAKTIYKTMFENQKIYKLQ